MLKKLFLIFFLLSLTNCSQKIENRKIAKQIPTGKWKYQILIKDQIIGDAEIETALKENNYINRSTLTIKSKKITNKSILVITESKKFEPIKYESYKITSINNNEAISKIVANFKKNKITVKTDLTNTIITIKEPFLLEGNYFLNELLNKKFSQNFSINKKIYEPSISNTKLLNYQIKSLGLKKVKFKNNFIKLYHIKQEIPNLTEINSYFNEKGILQLAKIKSFDTIIKLRIVK